MNHNYLNWELTQLLPERNHYYKASARKGIWLDINNKYILSSGNAISYNFTRDAWIYEDVRLYLEERGYFLGREFSTYDKETTYINVWYFDDIHEGCIIKEITNISYEEARNEAIKYCLNEINND